MGGIGPRSRPIHTCSNEAYSECFFKKQEDLTLLVYIESKEKNVIRASRNKTKKETKKIIRITKGQLAIAQLGESKLSFLYGQQGKFFATACNLIVTEKAKSDKCSAAK
jgi:hypothetical protein